MQKCSLAFCALFLVTTAAYARADEPKSQAFDIGPQALPAALTIFARQSHEEILFAPEVVATKRTAGVKGTMEPLVALKVLLRDTGLPFSSTPSGAILVGTPSANVAQSASAGSTAPNDPPTEDTKETGKKSSQDFRVAQATTGSNQGSVPVGVAPTVASGLGQGEALEEIIVTAQKRNERLLDTPQSVSVLSADTLDKLGAVQLSDWANTIPGLSFTTSGPGQTQITLRGVTTGISNNPTVGIYVDDVPYGSSSAFNFGARLAFDAGLFDMDRIEVLRGPQGTLYGASTMGGLIKYVTKQPDTSGFNGEAQAGVSSTAHGGMNYNVAAAVNIPLAPGTVALRASGYEFHEGGYIDNVATGTTDVNRSNVYGGRLDLLFTPTESLSIRVGGFLQNITRDGNSVADYALDGVPVHGDLDQYRQFAEPFNQHFRLVSGTITYEFGPATLTSISSYQTSQSKLFTDVSEEFVPLLNNFGLPYGAVGVPDEFDTNKITQELRLASAKTDAFEWLIGGFYTHESSQYNEAFALLTPTLQPAPNDLYTLSQPSIFEEYAAFADLTYHFTRKLDVTGGIRYSRNNQNYSQDTTGILVAGTPLQRSSEGVTTYLANARYHFTDDAIGYLRYATGYRPGGPNYAVNNPLTGTPSAPSTFQSDTLKSYEAGFKADTADRRFGIDLAGYYIKWSNIQILTTRGGFGVNLNAPGGAKIGGAELTFSARPTTDFTASGTFAYQHAYLEEADTDLGNVAGERLPNVPRFMASGNADYVFSNGTSLRPTIGATVRYVTDRTTSFNDSTKFPQYRLPAYTTVDLRAGLLIKSVTAQLYVHNLFDERGQLSANTTYSVEGGPAWVTILQPRTIGITLSTHF